MKLVNVRHSTGEYPVRVQRSLLGEANTFRAYRDRPAVIVTDDVVAPLWLDPLLTALPEAEVVVLPAGESSKTLETVSSLWERLADAELGRDGLLIALGGGVVGDMTGFAAACWMRGIDFVQVPTTLLAQVDASVGGKTAVDMPAGKNLIGAFHQPLAVFIDTDTLDTLPTREFSAGLAEVVKTAIISGAPFFEWLEGNASALMQRDKQQLEEAIARCCEVKATIVSEDEREHGQRALLNLGHTFGHAIETLSGYSRFLHGEAVAIGLVLACALSERVCGLPTGFRPRLTRLLECFALPTRLPEDLDREALLEKMRLDKKHVRSGWRLVLARSVGDCFVEEFKDPGVLRELLESV